MLTAYRNFEHRETADARTKRLLMQKPEKVEASPYVVCLRQARSTARFLTENPKKAETPSPGLRGRWTLSWRRESPGSPDLPSTKAPLAR